jgi:natural product biosynthesis luciferase-like monooxygenase protein
VNFDVLLSSLRERGIRLKVESDELRVIAPKGAMTAEIADALRAHKPRLLAAFDERRQLRGEEDAPPIVREGEVWPMSFGQRRLWFIEQLGDTAGAYHMPSALRLRGPLDVGALRRSLDAIVERHWVLRSVYRQDGDEPTQQLLPASPLPLPIADLSDLPEHEREPRLRELARASVRVPFDLANGPVARFELFRLEHEDHVLLVNLHHIACDGWSIGIFATELGAHYRAAVDGTAARALPELPIQYGDFARWQRERNSGAAFERMTAYWKQKLQGAPALLELPTDRPRPPMQTYRGAAFRFRVPEPEAERIRALAQRSGATTFMVLLAAYKVLLARYSGQRDIVVGSPSAGRQQPVLEELIGFFVNTLALRSDLSANPSFAALLAQVRETTLEAFTHQDMPFDHLVEMLQPERSLDHSPLFQVWFALQNLRGGRLEFDGLRHEPFPLGEATAQFDLSLQMDEAADGIHGVLEYNVDLFDADTIARMAGHFVQLLRALVDAPQRPIFAAAMLPAEERRDLLARHRLERPSLPPALCLHRLFERAAEATPDRIALECGERRLDYRQLDRRANAMAARLREAGIGAESRVGLLLSRSEAMVVAMLGVLKAGAAYVPLDPTYPRDRLRYVAEHAAIAALVVEPALETLIELPDTPRLRVGQEQADTPPVTALDPGNAAYVIYTSGSTGTPKGVTLSHRNAVNFLCGMDEALGHADPSAPQRSCLAVTSMSFDISVLEIFWTLSRSERVVLQPDLRAVAIEAAFEDNSAPPLKFGLFYFASDEDRQAGRKYKLLLDGARFADERSFSAVWVPERHFHAFGGQFPNPSVAAAAVAAITRNIGIRAGSVVLPLHDPIRVAEEWSMVDNLSKGRVSLAFASGWHFNDFVFAPQNFAERYQVMQRQIDMVRKLWRGESLPRVGGTGQPVEVSIRPRPLQPELPVWVTAANSPETFRFAGSIGANVLTHLLGQSVAELKDKVAIYRNARAEAGFDREGGEIALMLHTFIADDHDTVRAAVSEPFKDYLRSSVNLVKPIAEAMGLDPDAHMDVLVEAGFQRYYSTAALFGTPDSCLPLLRTIMETGVTEIACLVDFGVEADTALRHLEHLDRLRERATHELRSPAAASVLSMQGPVDALRTREVQLLQCTPSYARLLLQEPGGAEALAGLETLLLGGEAVPPSLVEELHALGIGRICNMYGPTETTVWSAVGPASSDAGDKPTIGEAIVNTRLYILDEAFEPVPQGLAGELFIGGEGVARGYWARPDLSAERFLPDPHAGEPGARMYRTGDKVRLGADGRIRFLGRFDHQLKIGGFRVEAGEIETALQACPGVKEAVASLQDDGHGHARLVAHVQLRDGAEHDPASLRDALSLRLPAYMVPSAIAILEAMPLTPNGKIDRAALPAIAAQAAAQREYVEPRTQTERSLAAIWADLLGLERVGVTDNFFEIGGHSLLATQLNPRIREAFGVEISIRFLFASPIIADIAVRIDLLLQERATETAASDEAQDLEEVEF